MRFFNNWFQMKLLNYLYLPCGVLSQPPKLP